MAHPQLTADLIGMARTEALDAALEAIQNLRHKTATTFTPECSGQRGQDKCDILYDAYKAVEALKG